VRATAGVHPMIGTTCKLLSNMMTGVSKGFERKLTLVGVGYRAKIEGDILELSLGFSNPVRFPIPASISIKVPTNTEIIVSGIDKQIVGETAAKIRKFRPPECYKGKGVRYFGEVVKIKETKKK
jgi:large subunit ribosomal protein L6